MWCKCRWSCYRIQGECESEIRWAWGGIWWRRERVEQIQGGTCWECGGALWKIHVYGGGGKKKARTVDNRSRISNKNIYHMVRLKDETLPKKSETKKQEDCRKRGRPRLSWEDWVKRDVRKAEEEENRREKANRDEWKQIAKVAVQRSDNYI